MPNNDRLFALICGGGTGGHVMPALAVADALVARGHPRASVAFLGSSRGMEATVVPEHGYAATLYDLKSFPRTITLGHFAAGLKLVKALGLALGFVIKRRPEVVVSVGGYASVPGVFAAVLTRTPIVVLSYDAIPGRSSLVAGRFARRCAVAFPSSPLPRKTVTGAAIRKEILAVDRVRDRDAARRKLGLPLDRLVVLVVGGSQGSGALNDAVDSFVAVHRDRSDLAIRHVLGARNDDGQRQALDGSAGLLYEPIGFETDMPSAYAAADILLARAGATTVFEVAAVGIASILVPWPAAAEDHQTANAKVLADIGGAVVVAEADFTPGRLIDELAHLGNREVRDAMARLAATVGFRDGATRIAAVVEDCTAS